MWELRRYALWAGMWAGMVRPSMQRMFGWERGNGGLQPPRCCSLGAYIRAAGSTCLIVSQPVLVSQRLGFLPLAHLAQGGDHRLSGSRPYNASSNAPCRGVV